MAVTIRKATPKDLPTVRELGGRFYVEEKRKHDPDLLEDFPSRGGGKKQYGDLLANRRAVTFIAEDAGTPFGYVIATLEQASGPWNELRCLIFELFVDRKYRGRGTAASLVSKVRTWAARNGADVILVTSYSNSRGARRLYRKLGFSDWSTTFRQPLKRNRRP